MMKKKTLVVEGLAVALAAALCLSGCGSRELIQNGKNDKEHVDKEIQGTNTENTGDEKDTQTANETPNQTENGTSGSVDGQLPYIVESQSDAVFNEQVEWDNEYPGCLVMTTVDGVFLCEDTHKELSRSLQKNSEDAYVEFRDFYNNAKSALADVAVEEMNGMWYMYDNVTVARADSEVFSFYRTNSSYMGGAHPDIYVAGFSYDSKDGHRIKLDEIVADKQKLYDVVVQKLSAHEESDSFYDGWEETVHACILGDDGFGMEWMIADEGVEILFNTYSIGMYALGDIRVFLDFSSYGDIFHKNYVASNIDYVHVMNKNNEGNWECWFDVDGDGQGELIYIEEQISYYDGYENGVDMLISFGRTKEEALSHTITTNEEWYINDCYILRAQNGKYFLYVECAGYSDYEIICIYDINNPENGAVYLGYSPSAFYNFQPKDPQHFFLFDRAYVMGTYQVYSECYIGNDGMPVHYKDYYKVVSYNYDAIWDSSMTSPTENRFARDMIRITLKQDVTVRCYNDLSQKDMDAYSTIPAGTRIAPYCTDRDTYMTFILEDGRFIDLEYDPMNEDVWERTINGIPEDELLDGFIYVG